MITDMKFFTMKLGKIDGFGDAGDILSDIAKSKETEKEEAAPHASEEDKSKEGTDESDESEESAKPSDKGSEGEASKVEES